MTVNHPRYVSSPYLGQNSQGQLEVLTSHCSMRNGLLLISGLWLIQAAADLDYSSTVSKLLSCWDVDSSTCQSQVSVALPVLAGVLEDPTTTVSSLMLWAAPIASLTMSHQHAGLHCTVQISLDGLLQPEEAPLDAACAASTGSASCLASITASFNQSLSRISGVGLASHHSSLHGHCCKATAIAVHEHVAHASLINSSGTQHVAGRQLRLTEELMPQV